MTNHQPAKKKFGQHFLYDQRVIRRIISIADLRENERVLEIGPGRGHLTRSLSESGAIVTAIEIDDKLISGALLELGGEINVKIIHGDALNLPDSKMFDTGGSYKLVANLPYNVGTRILRNIVCGTNPPDLSVVMLQREVSRNLTPANGKMGILGAVIGAFATINHIFLVKPSSFRPPPKVMSSVMKLEAIRPPKVPVSRFPLYFDFVVKGFSSPRKQIHNSLSGGLVVSSERVKGTLLKCHIDPERRAQTLSVNEWVDLFDTACAEGYIDEFPPAI
jgi:16S rRNA (adenine1518-N6/adenine1519-N6)-dimethyltransferase